MWRSVVQIFIIFYSAYGHTKTMAEKIKAGVEAAGGESLLMET
jgi:flavodoxin